MSSLYRSHNFFIGNSNFFIGCSKINLDNLYNLYYIDCMEKLTSLFLRGIDLQLKNDFRSICVKRGKTMKEEIQRLMQEEIIKASKEKK